MIPRPKRLPRLWCALQGLLPWEANGNTPAHSPSRLMPGAVADPTHGGGQIQAVAGVPPADTGSHRETPPPRRV